MATMIAVAVIGCATATVTLGRATGATIVPIRAAFYYGWYPETENWASQYTPTLGHYNSSDPAIIDTQIRQAQAAGLDAFITSWWGQGTRTDQRLPIELAEAAKLGFDLAPYYEPEAVDDPTQQVVASDLTYLGNLAASYESSWLHVNGKPVIFVYNAEDVTQAGGCATVAKWEAANAGRFYVDMKVFPGYRSCPVQPESWHQYAPAATTENFAPYSVTVSPGFFKYDETTPRLARDLPAFTAALQAQVASGAQWDLISTWNEWGEGTSVEPSTTWGMSYLDAMASVYDPAAPPPSTTTTAPTTTTTSTTSSVTAAASGTAYVYSGATGANHGGAVPLEMSESTYRTLLSFNTSAVPAGSTVTGATLTVPSETAPSSGGIQVHAEGTFAQSSVTWANQPTFNRAVLATSTTPAAGSTVSIPLPGSSVTPAGTTSFALTYSASQVIEKIGSAASLTVNFAPPTTSSPTTVAPTTTTASTTTTTAPATTTTTKPPVTTTTVPVTGTHITKVLTVVEENHSLAEMQAGMPYLDSLAELYGYATDYTAVHHPSLPNYLVIADGSYFGISDDDAPSSHPVAGVSVFDQAITADHTAKTYAETMASNCELESSGLYAVKHNPWAYNNASASRANCAKYDVPAGTPTSGALATDVAAGTLPDVGLLVPNLCDDAHNGGACNLTVADNWLQSWLPTIIAGPDFQSGDLAIVVTADEDDGSEGNTVLTVVVTRALDDAHMVVTEALNHYSLSRWYSDLSGSSPLNNAARAPDMPTAFDLP